MSGKITLFTIANQGAKMLNDLLKDSNIISIVDCPFVIQTFCSYNCGIGSLKQLDVSWDMEQQCDISFPKFRDTILYPAITQIAYTIKSYGKKYSSITMDTHPNSEVCNCGIVSLRVIQCTNPKSKVDKLYLDTAFFEMMDN